MNHPGANPAAPPSVTASSSSWFLGAPVTKFFTWLSTLLFVGSHSPHMQYLFHPSRNSNHTTTLLSTLQHYLTFDTTAEFLLGLPLLCILMRQYEREMGSKTILQLIVTTTIVIFMSKLFSLQTQILHMISSTTTTTGADSHKNYSTTSTAATMNGTAGLLYPWLGAIFYLFHRYTPRLHPRFVSMGNVCHLSEKSLYYLWLWSLLFLVRSKSQQPKSHTFVQILQGMMASIVYLQFVSRIHIPSLLVPERWISSLATWGNRLVMETPPRIYVPQFQLQHGGGAASMLAQPPTLQPLAPRRGGRPQHPIAPQAQAAAQARIMQHQQQLQQFFRNNSGGAAAPAAATVVQADPSAIEQLVHMGFDRDRVIHALQRSNNDVQRAADHLLSSSD